ncbi:uncharacterized protein LOC133185953 [Saccostrea echinata]|uniref:uncharacterized protein LOC133185953 n=1 Tax=Saccostrea echinata TaxID=191078 RepID=UPI002A8107B2|nr:uncharacterized protein LOC133185953 [Saccostrea echinata]
MENNCLQSIQKLRCFKVFYDIGFLPYKISEDQNKLLQQRPEVTSVVRHQKRHPIGFNVNLFNLQNAQNKPINESLLPSSRVSKTPEEKCAIELSEDHRKEEDRKFEWRVYLASLQFTEDIHPPQTLSHNPNLIRRPRIHISPPLKETDLLFNNFTKQLILRQMIFPTIKDQYIFYMKNFPLLLERKTDEDIKTKSRKRTPSPKPVTGPELKRGIQLKCRLLDLQRDVNELEREEPDIVFETELRDNVFDPTTWDWNKIVWPFYIPKPSRETRRRRLISPI